MTFTWRVKNKKETPVEGAGRSASDRVSTKS